MALKPSYYNILEKKGGAWISAFIGGVGKTEKLDVDIIKMLKQSNKEYKEQQVKEPLEGPEYE